MGRWKVVYDEEESRHRLDYSDEYSVYVHADRVDLEELRAAHNADCDRYEARIAELEAERDDWERRCKNLVNAMAVHGYSAETLANIAEGEANEPD